jgi:hypothetical protein
VDLDTYTFQPEATGFFLRSFNIFLSSSSVNTGALCDVVETTDGGRVELAKEGDIDEDTIGVASANLELTLLIVLIDLGVVEGPRLKLFDACGFLRGGGPTGGGGGCIKTRTNHSAEQRVHIRMVVPIPQGISSSIVG